MGNVPVLTDFVDDIVIRRYQYEALGLILTNKTHRSMIVNGSVYQTARNLRKQGFSLGVALTLLTRLKPLMKLEKCEVCYE